MCVPETFIGTDSILVLLPNRFEGFICKVKIPCLLGQRKATDRPSYFLEKDNVTLRNHSEWSTPVLAKTRFDRLAPV